MKKFIALLLACVMVFSFSGCAKEQTNDETNAPATEGAAKTDAETPKEEPSTEKIHLVAPKLGFTEEQIKLEKENAEAKGEDLSWSAKYYIGVTEKIAKDYPNYDMEYVDWGWAETLDQKQRASILSGDVPSLVAGETFMPVYAASGMLDPLPQDIVDMVNPSFLIKNPEGVPVAVAYKSSIFMLFYNKTLMKNAGLDPESPPKTWEEWKEMSRIITEKGEGKVFGGGVPSFPHAGGSLRATPFFRQMGVDFGGGTTVSLTDPKMIETLQFIRDMNAYLPAGLGNSADEGPLWTEFQENETVAFAVNGSWQQAGLEANGVDWGVTELPLPEGGVTGNCMVGAVYVGVPTQAENKEDCFNLIRVLLDTELQKNVVYETVPSPLNIYIDSDAEYADNKTLKVATEALKNGTYAGLTTFDKNDAQIWEIINTKVLARTTMTNDSIEDICSEAQSEIENLLK
jgi:multiple sugar transport system substrate-binding protein